jgi:hypothetical protein
MPAVAPPCRDVQSTCHVLAVTDCSRIALRQALRSMDVPWREAVGCLREIWTKNVEMLWMKNVEMLWMKNVFFMEKNKYLAFKTFMVIVPTYITFINFFYEYIF